MGRVDRVYLYLMFASLWYSNQAHGFWPSVATGFAAVLVLTGLNFGLWKDKQ